MKQLTLKLACASLIFLATACASRPAKPELTWSGSLEPWTNETLQRGENLCGTHLAIHKGAGGVTWIRIHADGNGVKTPEFIDLPYDYYVIKETNAYRASVTVHYTTDETPAIKGVEVFLPEKEYPTTYLKDCGVK